MIVEYKGDRYEVPSWTRFMAIDANGIVSAYERKPITQQHRNYWVCAEENNQHMNLVTPIDAPDNTWKHSCEMVVPEVEEEWVVQEFSKLLYTFTATASAAQKHLQTLDSSHRMSKVERITL